MAYSGNEALAMPEDLSPIQVTADPVLSAFELPLRRTFYPLGYPLVLETNSQDVMQAAEEGWGEFQCMFHGGAGARLSGSGGRRFRVAIAGVGGSLQREFGFDCGRP